MRRDPNHRNSKRYNDEIAWRHSLRPRGRLIASSSRVRKMMKALVDWFAPERVSIKKRIDQGIRNAVAVGFRKYDKLSAIAPGQRKAA